MLRYVRRFHESTDSTGFDELRVAAGLTTTQPGFGNLQSLAVDDVRVQLASVPDASSFALVGMVALGHLGRWKRDQTQVRKELC